MIKRILKFFKRTSLEEVKEITKYPVVLETYGVVECLVKTRQPTVDTAYGTITYIYEDGTRRVINKD